MSSPPPAAEPRQALAETRPRLLVVDDDEALLEVMVELFQSEGYQVEAATSAGGALQRLSAARYDAVFSDILMPGMDGLQFLRALRARDLDLPVILLTGSPDLRTALEAIEEGALQYLIKPVSSATLLQAAARAASLGRLARLKRSALEHLGFDNKMLGDRASLEARFDLALQALWVAYQPIVQAQSGQLYGYEALMRSTDPLLPDPGTLLDAAERLGRQRDLGNALRDELLRSLPAGLRAPGLNLFVNAQAEDVSLDWAAPLAATGVPTVLEVTERTALTDIPDLRERVEGLRARGLRIAIDDLGSGYAGLTSFVALEPEIVKLDMALVRGVDREPLKQKLIGSLAGVCRDLGILVVAEGIETIGERETVTRLGCDLLQGFLLGRPQAGL